MKRKKIALTMVLVAILGGMIFAGCIEEENPKKVTETYPPSAETPTLAPEVPAELYLNIGETARTSKIEVTVISFEKTDYYEWYSDIVSQYYTQIAPEGKIYLLADVEIKNVGSERAYVGSSEFSVTDSEGFRYDPELYLGEDGLEMFKELYQNQKMQGKILFEFPEDAKRLKIQYDFGSMLTGVKLASWNLD